MTTETANYVFNVILYSSYFFLWVGVALTFLVLSLYKSYFGFGVVFISLVYMPGQFIDIFWSAEALFSIEALSLMVISFTFFYFPEARKLMKRSGFVFTRMILAMMFFNAAFIIMPGIFEFISQYCGTIDGHPLNGEFLRVQIDNFLWCLLCLGTMYSGFKDFMETEHGQDIHKKIFNAFKVVVKAE